MPTTNGYGEVAVSRPITKWPLRPPITLRYSACARLMR
jgi:hypothetical protein